MIVCNPQHAVDAVSAEYSNIVKVVEMLAPHFEKVAIAKSAAIADGFSPAAGEAIRKQLEGKQVGSGDTDLADLVAKKVVEKITGQSETKDPETTEESEDAAVADETETTSDK